MAFEYETLKLPYTLEKVYTPDFILPNGIVIEAKGRFMPNDRPKMLAVQKAHPDLDIRFLFMDPMKKLTKRGKTTYADWAEKNGFKWALGPKVPQEWIDERHT